ncbi:MAG: hypothetical protein HKM00_09580 [Gallionella sp.]|nr:hypothetical protein [Gallionella sp.]
METIKFSVQGSAPIPYEVKFHKLGNKLSAFCTCSAGENGQHCKHRIQILQGSDQGIVSGNNSQVPTVAAWLIGTNLEAALNAEIIAERDLVQAKNALSIAKKNLAHIMMHP